MKTLDIGLPAAAQVHEILSGQSNRLALILAENPSAEWRVRVTPGTVHRIEGLYLLAAERAIPIQFSRPENLSAREAAFFEDFRTHRLSGGRPGTRLRRRIAEGGAFLAEAIQALIRMGPVRETIAHPGKPLEEVVIIGAYGGDHIGDAAILGGVLIHLHEEYGVRRAHVMSHRPDHTRRLAGGLATPVSVSVHDYRPYRVDELFEKAEALVLAGGPLMDLPRVLAKHLAALGTARARGRPFLIDRIGIGPFKRRMSRWAARRLTRAAARITARTRGSASDPILAGLTFEVKRDPAFDYLATRGALSLLSTGASESIANLLAGSQGRLRIGINLRPIQHLWSKRGVAYSKATEDRFYEEFAKALIAFAEGAGQAVTYVFFPMNPIQFGSSDLAAAYRLHRHVGGAADLRVWESDPDVDAALHLLRHFDLAIAMRFHACIFALSQNLPVLGVDYFPGEGGKVEQLFHDLGRTDDVCRIDTMDADWLVGRLRAHGQVSKHAPSTGARQAVLK